MGAVVSKQETLSIQQNALRELHESSGTDFPGSDYHPPDRRNWMSGLGPDKLQLNHIVWPGTHNSATNQIGIPLITRPFAECQSLSIYEQLCVGTRLLDICVQKDRRVCNEIIPTYGIDVVMDDIKKFLSETESEIIILEIRTEFNHQDPPGFEEYLEEQLGEYLIHHDDRLFEKIITEVLPKRIICIWKPRDSAQPKAGGCLWSSEYIKDDWISTNLPLTKFESNLKRLEEQTPATARKFFYRVENTLTAQADNPLQLCVKDLTVRIHSFARLFIAQCFSRGFGDRLQVLSTDFIDDSFVDACVGLTHARVRAVSGSSSSRTTPVWFAKNSFMFGPKK